MKQYLAPASEVAKSSTELLLEDLELLCDGPLVDLQIAFDGGLIAVRSNEKLIYQESAETRWMRADGRARVRMLCAWLHNAACKYREVKAGPRSAGKVVA